MIDTERADDHADYYAIEGEKHRMYGCCFVNSEGVRERPPHD